MSGRTTASEGPRQSSTESLRHLRLERDRHVAFAFAAADLLIEVGNDGTIIAAAGAAQAILGMDPGLAGRPFLDFVAAADRPIARRLLKHVHAQLRIDPVVVGLVRGDGVTTSILFGACRLPDRDDSVFLSVTLLPYALAPIDRPRDAATGLLTPDALREAALRLALDDGATRQLELVRLDGLSSAARQLPDDRARMLMHEIGAALRACSIGGDAAGRLAEDAFGIVTRASNDPGS